MVLDTLLSLSEDVGGDHTFLRYNIIYVRSL